MSSCSYVVDQGMWDEAASFGNAAVIAISLDNELHSLYKLYAEYDPSHRLNVAYSSYLLLYAIGNILKKNIIIISDGQ